MPIPLILTNPLQALIARTITAQGGWLGFDDFMSMALYTPGLGYYANANVKFGLMPYGAAAQAGKTNEGSDFATAPEMTPLFGQALAQQVAQALRETQTDEIWEFGAGSGALAMHLLDELARLGRPVERYTIVDVSGELRARQQVRLVMHGDTVRWVDALPQQMQGVLIGNEVMDAMPVQLLARQGGSWFERGVALHPNFPVDATDRSILAEQKAANSQPDPQFVWADRPTDLRPTLAIDGNHDYVTETHREAHAFVSTLADKLVQGAIFLVDYGFPEHEYYHPQRHMGTVMCHQAHRSDTNPLADVGLKDITAHVNFTGLAMAAQDAGLEVLGYCTQARFLMNCGLLEKLKDASFADKSMAQKLILEHEMGELFKVIGFAKGPSWQALGFAQGDRTHTL